jgi:hypothetical protein
MELLERKIDIFPYHEKNPYPLSCIGRIVHFRRHRPECGLLPITSLSEFVKFAV